LEELENQKDNVVDDVDKKSKFEELETQYVFSYGVNIKFREYVDVKYGRNRHLDTQEVKEELDQLILVGLNYSLKNYKTASTTTSILFNRKKPRKDVLLKLTKISSILSDNPNYPHLKPLQIRQVVASVLGRVDSRTELQYTKCVRDYSIPNRVSGTFNVTTFCNLLQQQQLLLDDDEL